MLYYLLYPLKDLFIGFNVFKYITFRAAMACASSFLISVIFGQLLINKLTQLRIGQSIRKEEAPTLYPLHKQKEGTPTMGGLLILLAVAGSTLLWGNLSNKFIWLVLLVSLWMGSVGAVDDYIKLTKRRSLGLTAKKKFLYQASVALFVASFLYFDPDFSKSLEVPFFKYASFNLGLLFIPFAMLVIVGATNAVNLTDGLDGLAIGCMVMVGIAYTVMSYVAGHFQFADYLQVFYIPGAGELAVFCASIIGACLGFLWFNSHPASVFMGDTGALALGGAIGAVAVFIKKELLLVIVGGVFVIEALSVMMQVASFKLNRRRIFLMSPLHHHFQLKGIAENKVTVRFWIVSAIFALLSLATLKLR